jgi:tRNA threonylcarbamoyladenosine biosynthesis protein TsaE
LAAPEEEERRTGSEAETAAAGRWLAARLAPGAVVRLHGELGAGKTCFTRGLAEGLGAGPADVHSPSFSLIHAYRNAAGAPVLHHVDLHRIEADLDLREIGIEEVLASGVPVAVEWAERMDDARYPPAAGDWEVRISVAGPGERAISMRRL